MDSKISASNRSVSALKETTGKVQMIRRIKVHQADSDFMRAENERGRKITQVK